MVHLSDFLVTDEEPLSRGYGPLTLEKQINVQGIKVLMTKKSFYS